MTAEMRWGSSTFVYSYLIFTELTFQPLSLGDNLTREEMKRLGGGRSGSSSFFVLFKTTTTKNPTQHASLASKNYTYICPITKYILEGHCLFNLILPNRGLSADNPHGPLRDIFHGPGKQMSAAEEIITRACLHLRWLLRSLLTRSQPKSQYKAYPGRELEGDAGAASSLQPGSWKERFRAEPSSPGPAPAALPAALIVRGGHRAPHPAGLAPGLPSPAALHRADLGACPHRAPRRRGAALPLPGAVGALRKGAERRGGGRMALLSATFLPPPPRSVIRPLPAARGARGVRAAHGSEEGRGEGGRSLQQASPAGGGGAARVAQPEPPFPPCLPPSLTRCRPCGGRF